MTNENYKRACDIQKEIDLLNGHLSDLDKARFRESTGCGFTYRFNDHHSEVKLYGTFVQASFPFDYEQRVRDKISELQKKFETL